MLRWNVVEVPTPFAIAWLERRLYQAIQKTLEKVTGRLLDIQFRVKSGATDPPLTPPSQGGEREISLYQRWERSTPPLTKGGLGGVPPLRITSQAACGRPEPHRPGQPSPVLPSIPGTLSGPSWWGLPTG